MIEQDGTIRLEAIASSLEAIASRLEAIATSVFFNIMYVQG